MRPVKATAIQQTITLLEQEIEALAQRRVELERVIESLRPLAGEASSLTRGRREAAKKRTDRPTDRAKRGPPRTPRSLPDVTPTRAAKVDAILTALREHSPQSPSELAKALKLKRATLAYQLKPLVASGAVMATGVTANRQYRLPPRSRAAKEAP